MVADFAYTMCQKYYPTQPFSFFSQATSEQTHEIVLLTQSISNTNPETCTITNTFNTHHKYHHHHCQHHQQHHYHPSPPATKPPLPTPSTTPLPAPPITKTINTNTINNTINSITDHEAVLEVCSLTKKIQINPPFEPPSKPSYLWMDSWMNHG
jgi:hypothetical protein